MYGGDVMAIDIQMSLFITIWLAVAFGLPVAMIVYDRIKRWIR